MFLFFEKCFGNGTILLKSLPILQISGTSLGGSYLQLSGKVFLGEVFVSDPVMKSEPRGLLEP